MTKGNNFKSPQNMARTEGGMRMKLQFRVEYEFEIDDRKYSGVETEASWFYIDQRGEFYDSSPLRPISPVGEKYTKLIPLIKIGDEYLSVDEIEKRLKASKHE